MKLLLAELFLFSISLSTSLHAHSIDSINCSNENSKLSIEIYQESDLSAKSVKWSITLITDESARIEGGGLWQKEIDSDDAFSSFDETSAISYKNNRAIFALDSGNGQAIYFPQCSSKTNLKPLELL